MPPIADRTAQRLPDLSQEVAEPPLRRELRLLRLLGILRLLRLLRIRRGRHRINVKGQERSADSASRLTNLTPETLIAEQTADPAPDQPSNGST